MTDGIIKWFNLDRGFGMITATDGAEVFMPYSAVRDRALRYPQAGQRVHFEMMRSTHEFLEQTAGWRASRVLLADA